ncbi:hypothetical protein [Streptomyces sp. NPDC039016]|uniref:hypothetical protein n=1 Tax=Streptomyces sp. NPDC039016 TaxID=3154330 RepID=UPI0033EE68FF
MSGTDQAGQTDGEVGVVAGVEVGVYAGEFGRQLFGARQVVVLADAEHRVPQAADEELSHRYVLSRCCRRCRERDAGGRRGRESKELPSPH